MRSTKVARPLAAGRSLLRGLPAASPSHAVAPCTVLVVDDRPGAAGEFAIGLRRAHFSVQLTGSLPERLQERRRPDVVILRLATDAGMEQLQALKTSGPVPVIVLLEDLTALPALHALDLPLFDFLVAPHSAEECVQRVEHALALRHRFQELKDRAQKLEHEVSVDFKTGLISELYFRRILQLEWKRALRHENPLSLLLLDIDDFKGVNDSTEYEFGDLVLQSVGETVLHSVRETDFAARLGGDEFCVLLPQTPASEAMHTASRIAENVAALTVRGGGFTRRVTVSIGVDSFDGRAPTSLERLRQCANQALHQAKRHGKNQVRNAASDWHARAH
jgi:two-component system, cell cycle response regulator